MNKNYQPSRLRATSTDCILNRPLCIRNKLKDRTVSSFLFPAQETKPDRRLVDASCQQAH